MAKHEITTSFRHEDGRIASTTEAGGLMVAYFRAVRSREEATIPRTGDVGLYANIPGGRHALVLSAWRDAGELCLRLANGEVLRGEHPSLGHAAQKLRRGHHPARVLRESYCGGHDRMMRVA